MLLQKRPEILSYVSAKFAWILVDEFQDTTDLQVEILSLIAATNARSFCSSATRVSQSTALREHGPILPMNLRGGSVRVPIFTSRETSGRVPQSSTTPTCYTRARLVRLASVREEIH